MLGYENWKGSYRTVFPFTGPGMQIERNSPLICSLCLFLPWLPPVKTRNKEKEGQRVGLELWRSEDQDGGRSAGSTSAGEDEGFESGGSNFLLWEGKCEKVVRTVM